MQSSPDGNSLAHWIRARPLVGWLIAVFVIFVCLGSVAVHQWAKAAVASPSASGNGTLIKGVGLVLGALFIVWRARGQMRR